MSSSSSNNAAHSYIETLDGRRLVVGHNIVHVSTECHRDGELVALLRALAEIADAATHAGKHLSQASQRLGELRLALRLLLIGLGLTQLVLHRLDARLQVLLLGTGLAFDTRGK